MASACTPVRGTPPEDARDGHRYRSSRPAYRPRNSAAPAPADSPPCVPPSSASAAVAAPCRAPAWICPAVQTTPPLRSCAPCPSATGDPAPSRSPAPSVGLPGSKPACAARRGHRDALSPPLEDHAGAPPRRSPAANPAWHIEANNLPQTPITPPLLSPGAAVHSQLSARSHAFCRKNLSAQRLSLIHISEPTRRTP